MRNLLKNNKVYYTVMSICIIVFMLSAGYLFKLGFDVYQDYRNAVEIGKFEASKNGVFYEDELSKEVFLIEGKVSDFIVDYAMVYYSALPKGVRDDFNSEGWKLVLTDREIQGTYYNGAVEGRIAGVTSYADKTIHIHSRMTDIRRSLIHEFGHYIDCNNGFISRKDEFVGLYKKEKGLLNEKWKIDDHASSNSSEFFAECFNMFILYNDDCKKQVPETYKFFNENLFLLLE